MKIESNRAGFRKTRFLKPNPLGFGVLLGLNFIGFFGFFHLNEQLESLLVDLAHQLSLYSDSPVLQVI